MNEKALIKTRLADFVKGKKYVIITMLIMVAIWISSKGYIAGDIENAVVYIPQYCLDLKVGFVSRTFIGTIMRLIFGDIITIGNIKAIIFINEAVCITVFSVICGKFIENRKGMMPSFFVALAVVSFASIRFFITELWPSVFDHYWLTIMLLCVCCMFGKYTKFLIPVLCFVGLWINYGFALCFFPIVMILLYYCMVFGHNRKSDTFVFVFTGVTGVFFTVYFFMFANKNLKMDIEELHQYITTRITKAQIDFLAIDAYLFETLNGKKYSSLFDMLFDGYNELKFSIMLPQQTIISGLVIVIVFSVFWLFILLKCEDIRMKIASIFNICLLPVALLTCCVTGDKSRHMAFAIIAEIFSLCALIYLNEAYISELLDKIENYLKAKVHIPIFAMAFAVAYTEFFRNVDLVFFGITFAFAAAFFLLVRKKIYLSCFVCSALSLLSTDFLLLYSFPLICMMYSAGRLEQENIYKKKFALSLIIETLSSIFFFIYDSIFSTRLHFECIVSLNLNNCIALVSVIVFYMLMIAVFKNSGAVFFHYAVYTVLMLTAVISSFVQMNLNFRSYNAVVVYMISYAAFLSFYSSRKLILIQKYVNCKTEKESYIACAGISVLLSLMM